MKQLSIKEIALYGFGAVFITFISTIIATILYLNQMEALEKEADFYEKSYESLFDFKYYTERLLTTHNLEEETILWLNSKDNFEKYFKEIEDSSDINYENFVNFWHVIDDESKKIKNKLQNKLFDKSNTQERSILRRLGEGLNMNKSSDYYLALSDLKNSIDYIKQYEEFLLDELKAIKSKKLSYIFGQIETAKKTLYVFITFLIVLSMGILYYVVNLISKVEKKLKKSLVELKASNDEKESLNSSILDNYEKTLHALVDMIEERDTYTGGHSQRVADYSVKIAKEMGYEKEDIEKIYQAGILHDIGKMNIPDSVLLKPGKLDSIEFGLIKEHAENGYRFLKQIPMYKELANIIRYHHERYDGRGYPTGKEGNNISILSYILSAADAFDAMTTSRIYKARKSVKEALIEIEKCTHTQFHPAVTQAVVKVLKDVEIDRNISQIPKSTLEMERFSSFYKDQISGLYNEQYLEFILNDNCDKSEYIHMNLFLMKNFSQYNHQNSWNRGNKILYDFAQYLRNSFKDSIIFRIHGDDFVVLHNQDIVVKEQFYMELEMMKNSGIIIKHVAIKLIDEKICSLIELENRLKTVVI